MKYQVAKLTRLIGDVLPLKVQKFMMKSLPKMILGESRIIINDKTLTVKMNLVVPNHINKRDHYKKNKTHLVVVIINNGITDVYACNPEILEKSFNVFYPNNCLVYVHEGTIMSEKGEEKGRTYNYHGFTSRTMAIRLAEHRKANSNFGSAFREFNFYSDVINIHTVIQDGMTRHDAFNLEEKVIKAHSLFRDNKGNNMIPGGYTGLRIAKRLGYKDRESAETDLEEAANNQKKLASICSKLYNWEPTDEQLSNIVCHNKNNFTKEEVRYIRILSLQIESIREIWKEFRDKYNYSIMNVGLFKRVESVVNGNSYRFVV